MMELWDVTLVESQHYRLTVDAEDEQMAGHVARAELIGKEAVYLSRTTSKVHSVVPRMTIDQALMRAIGEATENAPSDLEPEALGVLVADAIKFATTSYLGIDEGKRLIDGVNKALTPAKAAKK